MDQRIVNGSLAQVGAWPWAVLIGKKYTNGHFQVITPWCILGILVLGHLTSVPGDLRRYLDIPWHGT